MKKVISFMLMMILCLSLVACGSSQSEKEEVDDNNNQDTVITGILDGSDKEEEADYSYYKVGDTVETDILRATLDLVEFGIALNGDYVKVENVKAESDDILANYVEPTLSENYGLPVEYIEGESYLEVAATGHTLVVLDLTLENLDRVGVSKGIKKLYCSYGGEKYTIYNDDICIIGYLDDDGSIHPLNYSSVQGVPEISHFTGGFGVGEGETTTMRIYFDIPVEIDSSSDEFVLVLPVLNSSDEYEEFYFSIN